MVSPKCMCMPHCAEREHFCVELVSHDMARHYATGFGAIISAGLTHSSNCADVMTLLTAQPTRYCLHRAQVCVVVVNKQDMASTHPISTAASFKEHPFFMACFAMAPALSYPIRGVRQVTWRSRRT